MSRKTDISLLLLVITELLLACAIIVFLQSFVFQTFIVEGSSMIPTLNPEERVIVLKFYYKIHRPRRCDVVVFWYPLEPNKPFVKRIAALPGERIEIKSGHLFINGCRIEENCFKLSSDENMDVVYVPEGFYFVLGDNPESSNDSRFGWLVPEEYIFGKVVWTVWPIQEMRVVK